MAELPTLQSQSSKSDEILLVLTTWPDVEVARKAVRQLVEEKRVACGNIIPGVESIYRWEGKVETSPEVIVLFKTPAAAYSALEARIRELHSYEVPEILSFRACAGLPSYLRWVAESCLA